MWRFTLVKAKLPSSPTTRSSAGRGKIRTRKPVGPKKGRKIACQLLLQTSQTQLGENQFHLLPVKIDSGSKRQTPNQHLSLPGPRQGPTPPSLQDPQTQSTAEDGLCSALAGFSGLSFSLTLSPAPAWALHSRQGRSAPVPDAAQRCLPLLALPPPAPHFFPLTPLLVWRFCHFFHTLWKPHLWLKGWAGLGCRSLERLEASVAGPGQPSASSPRAPPTTPHGHGTTGRSQKLLGVRGGQRRR